MNLKEQFATKIAAAKAAAEAGNVEEAKKLRVEAEGLKCAMDELKALDGLTAGVSEPMRPPFPGLGTGAAPGKAESQTDAAVKAVYMTHFGNEQDAIKAVLTDLHGPDYKNAWYTQKRAFSAYLRMNPQLPIPEWIHNALRTIVMTPNAVKDALEQGADVQTLKTVMVEAADSLGGYTVPVDFQARVVSRLMGLTQVRQRADVGQTSRDRVEFPVATGGTSQYANAVRVTWVNETPTAGTAATNLTYGMEAIPIHTVMAETFLSRNTVEDSAVNLEADLTKAFSEAAAIDEDNRFLVGAGIGSPQGILPGSANGLSLTEALNGAAYDSTKANLGILWDGLIAATWKLDAQYRQNAAWIGNKTTYGAIATLKDSVGQYLWREVYGNSATAGGGGTIKTLLGYPVLEQEGMPTPATAAYPLVFGDFSGYWIRDRVGMSIERYLDSATARINQVIYVMRRRLGGQVTQPWRFVCFKLAAS
jgi:HK97 family phage major capsid protein